MNTLSETSATEVATGPHIPAPKWTEIGDWMVGNIHITNTVFSTWIFMGIIFSLIALFYVAIRTDRFPKTKAFGLDITSRMLVNITGLLWSQKQAENYMWLLWGIMFVVFAGNIFGLIVDWFVIVSKHEWLGHYLRPIYSDFSTTLVLGLTVVLVAQITAFYLKGPVKHLKHYLFHFEWATMTEKVVNVFVGWLHFMGEFIRVGSLSIRLFLNIFVGAILISVAIYIGTLIPSLNTGVWQFLSLPFWFFELLVAFLQAYIFMTLSSMYIQESFPDDSHH